MLKKKESFIYYKMRKSLLNFQHFCRGKIELGEGKVREILFLAEDGHPDDGTILRLPRKWSLKFHLNYLLLNCQKLYSEKNFKKNMSKCCLSKFLLTRVSAMSKVFICLLF